jgi:hypothetical protein
MPASLRDSALGDAQIGSALLHHFLDGDLHVLDVSVLDGDCEAAVP